MYGPVIWIALLKVICKKLFLKLILASYHKNELVKLRKQNQPIVSLYRQADAWYRTPMFIVWQSTHRWSDILECLAIEEMRWKQLNTIYSSTLYCLSSLNSWPIIILNLWKSYFRCSQFPLVVFLIWSSIHHVPI